MAHLYEIFSGEELTIAEKIQRRRYQILVHSYIYYEMNENIISDSQWSQWAMELVDLQVKYPELAKSVVYSEDFMDWDGSSGAFFDYSAKSNIVFTANRLLADKQKKQNPTVIMPTQKKPLINKTATTKKKLF
jgi:hypothetical protein